MVVWRWLEDWLCRERDWRAGVLLRLRCECAFDRFVIPPYDRQVRPLYCERCERKLWIVGDECRGD